MFESNHFNTSMFDARVFWRVNRMGDLVSVRLALKKSNRCDLVLLSAGE